jgi:hypothetical protein
MQKYPEKTKGNTSVKKYVPSAPLYRCAIKEHTNCNRTYETIYFQLNVMINYAAVFLVR